MFEKANLPEFHLETSCARSNSHCRLRATKCAAVHTLRTAWPYGCGTLHCSHRSLREHGEHRIGVYGPPAFMLARIATRVCGAKSPSLARFRLAVRRCGIA